MRYVGVDLHKHVMSVCVVGLENGRRHVVERRNLRCAETAEIQEFFQGLGEFQVVVEATSSYDWFAQLVEPLANRVVLAHPRKLRVIAESTRKTDKLDAQILAEFLAAGMIPEAYRASPRLRQYRTLVRHRYFLKRRSTGLKIKVRALLGRYNIDLPNAFARAGREQIASLQLSHADRLVMTQLQEGLERYALQVKEVDRGLLEFAETAPIAEREARAVLESIPCVGDVTIDVVLSELGDVRRFRSQKQVVAYAGLAPGIRESAGKARRQGITKEGSGLLRWVMVETAWRMVGKTRRWGLIYEQLKRRMGSKKAIVAVARRLLCVMVALMRSGQRYSLATEAFA